MSNPFQEQLLKAGLVTKQQVQQANQSKKKQHKQQGSKKNKPVDESQLIARKAAEEKAARARELNQRKQEQARQKALSAEINQLISANALKRGEDCDIAYNFEHNKKVKRIYINNDMKRQIIQGKLGIARIEGRYELVPLDTANKIRQRNEKRVVLFDDDTAQTADENDPYADYQVPDDLIW